MNDVKVLFLDQTAALGGAEFSLRDIASRHRSGGRVVLFEDGPFRQLLSDDGIPVEVLPTGFASFRRESRLLSSLTKVPALARAVVSIARRARRFDVVYANTQKAMLVGAIAGALARTPVVFHLHDILSEAHFTKTNRWLSTRFANALCTVVIADSEATGAAFVESGGRSELVSVVRYGFDTPTIERDRAEVLGELGVDPIDFVVGHFSRLSPWKGQEVLVEALRECPVDTHVLLVGDAIFGEHGFVASLEELIERRALQQQVSLIGFRSDVADLMAACDLVVHSSTAPEPFGRVIVEAMLTGTPVIASDAGGPREILRQGETGWLTAPGDASALGACITERHRDRAGSATVASAAFTDAEQRFAMERMHEAIDALLYTVVERS